MAIGGGKRKRWRRAAAVLLAGLGCLAWVSGCGKSEAPRAVSTGDGVAGSPSPNTAGLGKAAVASVGGYEVFVVPAVPSRSMPLTVSVKSPPGKGAEILGVGWYVNGTAEAGDRFLSPSLFRRGDRIHAVVKLKAGAREEVLTSPEVVAGNAQPEVTEVRIEPRALVSGATARAVAQARDPDGDSVTLRYKWYVDDKPRPGDGETLALAGVKRGSWVHVAVTPNDGAADGASKLSARYEVVNAPPVVKSLAPTAVPPSRLLKHTFVAEDADGDPLTYTLVKGPPGMTLHGDTLEWKVGDEYVGRQVEAVVEISDGHGGKTVQTLSMTIRRN